MHLSCCGINHHSSALTDRESLHIKRDDLAAAVIDFKRVSGTSEAAIVSTCNRIEFYRVDPDKPDARKDIRSFYSERGCPGADKLDNLLFVRQGSSAARHLFKVVAGLDSVLLGEYQVSGQVKDAYSAACSVSGPGRILHKLFHNAFHISKQVRTETELGKGAQGLGGAVVDILISLGNREFARCHAVVIGVNHTTEMLLLRLHREKCRITLVNRSLFKAEKLARSCGADACSLDSLQEILPSADLVFSATSADDYVVKREYFDLSAARKEVVFIDLAIPRDIDPDIANIPGFVLYDLDDMKRHLDQVQDERTADLPYALDLVEEQVSTFETWRKRLSNGTNSELRKILENDRSQIVQSFSDNFRQGDRKALEAFSRSLYRQFLRRVTSSPDSINKPSENTD